LHQYPLHTTNLKQLLSYGSPINSLNSRSFTNSETIKLLTITTITLSQTTLPKILVIKPYKT
ncbi:MAG: hypothetical protein ACXQTI_06035, partial [Candidatus Nezhaarchaeales archaeon]